MNSKSLVWFAVVLVVAAVLSFACAPPPPAPAAVTAAVTAQPAPTPPASVETAKPAEGPQLVPKTPEELASIDAMLQEGDKLYFAGKFDEARARFETAWSRMHPNPLALVMAGHAARRMGDATAAEGFFERAREEARKVVGPRPGCDPPQVVPFDGSSSAWFPLGENWARFDASEWRMLYGFVNDATRDPATKRGAAVTWMPRVLRTTWDHSDSTNTTTIELFDTAYGEVVGSLSYSVQHRDGNVAHGGWFFFSSNQTIAVSAGRGPGPAVRVWRVADRSLLRAIPALGVDERAKQLALSPDGSLVAVASSTEVTIWDTTTGGRISKVDVQLLGCVGSDRVYGMALSPDNRLLAVSYLAQEDPWIFGMSLFQTRDGRRVRYWKQDRNIGPGSDLLFSPDGSQILFRCATGNRLLNIKSGAVRMPGACTDPLAFGFSPDGGTLLTRRAICDLSGRKKPLMLDLYKSGALQWLDSSGPYLLPVPEVAEKAPHRP